MSPKVLVTGANGQLAKTLQKHFAKDKDNIAFTFVTKAELDITNVHLLAKYFKTHTYQYCINCAAYTNVEQAEKTPEIAFKVNAEAVKNLANICNKHNICLIHISTDYVFNGKKNEAYTEEDVTNPINEYGKSKLLGEHYIQEILNKYFIIRTSWLYSEFGNNFVKTIYSKRNKGEKLKITISEKGSPTSCKSLASFLSFLVFNKVDYGIYHYSSGVEITWFEFAKEILKHINLSDQYSIEPIDNYITSAQRPKFSVLNNTKRSKHYKADSSFDEEIKEIITLL